MFQFRQWNEANATEWETRWGEIRYQMFCQRRLLWLWLLSLLLLNASTWDYSSPLRMPYLDPIVWRMVDLCACVFMCVCVNRIIHVRCTEIWSKYCNINMRVLCDYGPEIFHRNEIKKKRGIRVCDGWSAVTATAPAAESKRRNGKKKKNKRLSMLSVLRVLWVFRMWTDQSGRLGIQLKTLENDSIN